MGVFETGPCDFGGCRFCGFRRLCFLEGDLELLKPEIIKGLWTVQLGSITFFFFSHWQSLSHVFHESTTVIVCVTVVYRVRMPKKRGCGLVATSLQNSIDWKFL